jgi:hypothetical protein
MPGFRLPQFTFLLEAISRNFDMGRVFGVDD